MSIEYTALNLSPMIPSYSLKETTHFFKEVLGFSTIMDTLTYAVLQKNNLSVHILQAGENIGQMEFYLEVDNIDRLWNSIKEKVMSLKVREPFNQEYGMREFHIEIPRTKTLLFVGQQITNVK